MKKPIITKSNSLKIAKSSFWFVVGVGLGLFFSISFAFIIFQRVFGNTVYPGIYIGNVNFGGKTEQQVISYFDKKNQQLANVPITFSYNGEFATSSAKVLGIGYNSKLLAHQAFITGRSQYLFSDIVLVFNAYITGVFLNPSFSFSEKALTDTLAPISKEANIPATDAIFTFQNGRVTTFRPSSEGQQLDTLSAEKTLANKIPSLFYENGQQMTIPLAITILKPKVATKDVNNLGITELIGEGTSLFQHSIPQRVFNVTLATTRLNGILIAPGEEFSFDKALGDVSAFTGYQQAYVITNGKTVLGDGGGVCQTSTTMFRAALNAGLPITERHGHAYRVGYYEEDSPPGIDATIYVPSVDLKFKNDTGHYILIQTVVDPVELRLTYYLYGTRDGRQVSMTTPVVTNQTPAPPPLFTDDPTLPKGVTKQVDFAANGATASFNRTVTRNGKTLYQDTFTTNYQAWQAAYLRGTRDN